MATLTDILISELEPTGVASDIDDVVLNKYEPTKNEFVTKRIKWQDLSSSLNDLSGGIDSDGNQVEINQIMFADGTQQKPSITFKSDSSTGVYKDKFVPGTVAITSLGREVLRATTVGLDKRVGIGLQPNDSPENSLHIKGGGIKVEFGGDNILEFVPTNGHPSINTGTGQPLIFKLENQEVGRFDTNYHLNLYSSIGVGDVRGIPGSVSYGDEGDLLFSGGSLKPMEWKNTSELFIDSIDIIIDALMTRLDDGLEVITSDGVRFIRVNSSIARGTYDFPTTKNTQFFSEKYDLNDLDTLPE